MLKRDFEINEQPRNVRDHTGKADADGLQV